MFNFIKKYYRKRLLKINKGSTESTFLNIKEIHSICFAYEIHNTDDLKQFGSIYKFIEEKKIPFKGLAIVTKKSLLPKSKAENGAEVAVILPEELKKKNVHIVFPQQLTWVGAIKDVSTQPFFKEKYDLFISFDTSGSFTLNYAMQFIISRMRIGMTDGKNYTMVINGKQDSILTYNEYLNEVFNYLNIINIKLKR